MRKVLLGVIIVIPVVAAFLFVHARLSGYRIELKTHFHDAQGLRPGASVRIAGVDVGSVTSVRVRPELGENAAEVVMDLHTPYELKIPRDSVASLQTAGVLGPTFVEIHMAGASGQPANNGTVLNSKETEPLSTKELIEKVENVLQRKPCDSESGVETSDSGQKNKSGQKQQVLH
jgi:phospholipid/cholesterol/gamma-HCH transport system substrate-binding protein